MSTTGVLAGSVLAKSGEAAKAGPIGFVVIIVLCIACYFLFKSMSKHLRKVREEFPETLPPAPGTPARPSGGSTPPAQVVPPAEQSDS